MGKRLDLHQGLLGLLDIQTQSRREQSRLRRSQPCILHPADLVSSPQASSPVAIGRGISYSRSGHFLSWGFPSRPVPVSTYILESTHQLPNFPRPTTAYPASCWTGGRGDESTIPVLCSRRNIRTACPGLLNDLLLLNEEDPPSLSDQSYLESSILGWILILSTLFTPSWCQA